MFTFSSFFAYRYSFFYGTDASPCASHVFSGLQEFALFQTLVRVRRPAFSEFRAVQVEKKFHFTRSTIEKRVLYTCRNVFRPTRFGPETPCTFIRTRQAVSHRVPSVDIRNSAAGCPPMHVNEREISFVMVYITRNRLPRATDEITRGTKCPGEKCDFHRFPRSNRFHFRLLNGDTCVAVPETMWISRDRLTGIYLRGYDLPRFYLLNGIYGIRFTAKGHAILY